jgi:hypothetical protein
MTEPAIHDLVAADLRDRLRVGIETYGEPLTVHTAIDPLQYLYEELLDAACYIRQEIERRGRAGS